MTLKHSIIHKIERSTPGGDINCVHKEQENSASGAIHSLFEQLKQSFQRSAQKEHGHFDRSLSDNPLPQWIKEQQEGKSSFVRISQRVLEHLQQQLNNTEDAFSAHLIFAVDTVMEQDLLYIFWVSHVDTLHINSDLEVANCAYIDANKLQYGAKIYINEWLEQDSPKYLSLLTSRGNKAFSDAYTAFIGFTAGVDLVEDTNEFLDIVDQYAQSLPEENVNEYKNQVLNYCVEQDKQGFPVVFEDISQQLNEKEPEQFSSFIADKQQNPKLEIYTDRSSLKRYVRYFGRDKNMSISFSADQFGEDIVYDEHTGILTIKQIPKSLKQQLSRSKEAS
ncbi:nucleoid-associated protein [bacterium AH-315-K03]|nr:nucleoid-associated protein [bacterium AH-315-K03]